MMNKSMKIRLLPMVVVFVLFGVLVRQVAAQVTSTLKLLSIGTSSTADLTFIEWSYVGENPEFIGEASPSAEVSVGLNGAANAVTADVNGGWSFVPLTLTAGSHEVSITSGSESITFTLSISSTSSSSSSSSSSGSIDLPETLPQTGGFEQTLALVLAGVILVGLGMMTRSKWETV